MTTLPELQQAAHALAKEKGWWDGERDPDEVYANFHAEISEAWEEYRSGRPIIEIGTEVGPTEIFSHMLALPLTKEQQVEAWHYHLLDLAKKGRKPEGFFVELADLVIRIADAAEAWGMELEEEDLEMEELSVAAFVNLAHGVTCKCKVMHEWKEEKRLPEPLLNEEEKYLSEIVNGCFDFAHQHGVDLWGIIRLKHEYNKTRPYRHSGKIA